MSGILQGLITSISESEEYGAVGWTSSPYLTFFKKQGNRFIQLADPTTMPTAAVTKISWSRFGNYCGVLLTNGTAQVYLVSGDTVTYKGATGSSLIDIAWSKERTDPTDDENWLGLLQADGGFDYRFNSKEFIGFAFIENGALSPSVASSVCFLLGYNSSNGSVLITNTSRDDGQLLVVRELDGIGASELTGRILTQPSDAPKYCASRNSGTAFAVVTNAATDNILIYTRSGANWDIAHTLSAGGTPTRCAWSADGNLLGVVHDTSPYYSVVDFTGETPTVVAGTTVLAAAGNDITMSRDNFTALTATSSSNFLQMQRRNSDGVWDLSSTADFSFSESNALAVSLKNNAYVGN
jgi:hypothetical protein